MASSRRLNSLQNRSVSKPGIGDITDTMMLPRTQAPPPAASPIKSVSKGKRARSELQSPLPLGQARTPQRMRQPLAEVATPFSSIAQLLSTPPSTFDLANILQLSATPGPPLPAQAPAPQAQAQAHPQAQPNVQELLQHVLIAVNRLAQALMQQGA